MGKDIKSSSVDEAIGTILAKLCYSVADEIGAHFGEKVGNWRRRNVKKILESSEQKYDEFSKTGQEQVPPRLLGRILEEGSWTEDQRIQEMWSGLLVSSCSLDGRDDGNLIFVDILSRMTKVQARVLEHSCSSVTVQLSSGGWLETAEPIQVNLSTLMDISGVNDRHRLDRELDVMRQLGLIAAGFHPRTQDAEITPTPLALQMYAKCQGNMGSVLEFFEIQPADPHTDKSD